MRGTRNRWAMMTSVALGAMLAAKVGLAQTPAELAYSEKIGRAVYFPEPGPAEAKILKELDEPTTMEFNETPLKDVVEQLKLQHGIEMQLDTKALADANIAPDTPITKTLKGVTLRSGLRLMLGEHDLNFIIDHEALLITTAEKAKSLTVIRVYPVRDLVMVRYEDGVDEDYDSLIEVITSTVAPASWDSAGGAGSIAPFGNPSALVVNETQEVHEQVEVLLAALRAAREAQGIHAVDGAATRRREATSETDNSGSALQTQADADLEPPHRIHASGPQAAWRVPQVYK